MPDHAAGKEGPALAPAVPARKRKPILRLLDPPDVELGRKLGCGGFGTVYEATFVLTPSKNGLICFVICRKYFF